VVDLLTVGDLSGSNNIKGVEFLQCGTARHAPASQVEGQVPRAGERRKEERSWERN